MSGSEAESKLDDFIDLGSSPDSQRSLVSDSQGSETEGEGQESPVRKERFRFVGLYRNKEAARSDIESREDSRYRLAYTSHSTNFKRAVYKCTSHALCPHKYRITTRYDTPDVVGEAALKHAKAPAESKMPGIARSMQEQVDGLLRGGAGPKMCQVTLLRKYKNDPSMLQKVPSMSQLKNRKAYLKKGPSGTGTCTLCSRKEDILFK